MLPGSVPVTCPTPFPLDLGAEPGGDLFVSLFRGVLVDQRGRVEA